MQSRRQRGYHPKNTQYTYEKPRNNNYSHNYTNSSNFIPKEPKLFLDSVKNYFRNIISMNKSSKNYDKAVELLKNVMKMTFEKNTFTFDLNMINTLNNKSFVGEYVVIKPGKYDGERWVKLYISCLPDLSFPEYSKNWANPIIWAYKNVLEGIDSITKSQYIKDTQTINSNTNQPEMDREEYKLTIARMNNSRELIMKLIKEIILQSNMDKIESIKEKLLLPDFENNSTAIYSFFAIRLVWMLITLRGSYINFGDDLNKFTKLINYSQKNPGDLYINAMKILRSHGELETKYGLDLCLCLANLLERTYIYHYFGDTLNSYIIAMRNIINSYLQSGINTIRPRSFLNTKTTPIEKEINTICNRFTSENEKQTIISLYTYNRKDIDNYVLPYIINNKNPCYEQYLLLMRFFEKNTVKKETINGICGRRSDIATKQLYFLVKLNLITIQEIYEEKLAKGDNFMEIVKFIFDDNETRLNREFLMNIKEELNKQCNEPVSKHYLRRIISQTN